MDAAAAADGDLRPALIPAGALIAWGVATALLSQRFGAPNAPADEPIVTFVVLQIAGGAVWLWLLAALRPPVPPRRALTLVVGIGLLLRLTLFASTPILENDYQRYLWDGGVVASGLDPYAHAPDKLLASEAAQASEWDPLIEEGRPVLEQVGHGHLATIYPAVAQGAFALAHGLAPWKPLGLRMVWLGLDLVILLLLLHALGSHKDRAWRLAVYWLNPLLLKEIYNGLHMELVLLVFATAALVWAGRGKILAACAFLGLAIGSKLWPALWLPLLLRWRGVRRRDVLWGVAIAGSLATLLLLPMVLRALGGGESASGLSAYARTWEMNDSAFVLIQGLCRTLTLPHAELAARAVVGGLLLLLVWRQTRRPVEDAADLAQRALVIVAALFLLSPTQFPWYFLWCLPALALRPSLPLLLLTITLPLYYLRFRFVELGLAAWFDYGVVWSQFVPTWILLVRQYAQARIPPRVEICHS